MTHEELIELVFQFEDLTDEEKQIADTHLVQCPTCRAMLDGVRAAEAQAGQREQTQRLATDSPDAPSSALTGDDLRQAEVSRARLLARVRSGGSRRQLKAAGLGGMVLALAASLVLVLGLPKSGEDTSLIQNLSMTAPRLLRGDEAPALQPGDPFVVRFTLAEAGWPVVVALDSDGAPEVLYPRDAEAPRLEAAVPLVLPEVGSPVTWRLRGAGTSVWVALGRDRAPDLEALRGDLAGATSADGVRSRLESRFGSAAVSMVALPRP